MYYLFILKSNFDFFTETKANRKKYLNSKFNILYGTTKRESYDVYFKDKEETSKVFVYVHGGCWQMLDKDISGYCVAPLVEEDYRVIVVGYNLCPSVSLKTITEEIKKCVNHILQYVMSTGAG